MLHEFGGLVMMFKDKVEFVRNNVSKTIALVWFLILQYFQCMNLQVNILIFSNILIVFE